MKTRLLAHFEEAMAECLNRPYYDYQFATISIKAADNILMALHRYYVSCKIDETIPSCYLIEELDTREREKMTYHAENVIKLHNLNIFYAWVQQLDAHELEPYFPEHELMELFLPYEQTV